MNAPDKAALAGIGESRLRKEDALSCRRCEGV